MNLKPRIPLILKAAFIGIFLALLIAFRLGVNAVNNHLLEVRQTLLKTLDELCAPELKATINDVHANSPLLLREEIQSMKKHDFHHSSPQRRYSIVLMDNCRSVTLEIAQGSDYPSEFWVFNPYPFIFKDTVIGSIRSEKLLRVCESVP